MWILGFKQTKWWAEQKGTPACVWSRDRQMPAMEEEIKAQQTQARKEMRSPKAPATNRPARRKAQHLQSQSPPALPASASDHFSVDLCVKLVIDCFGLGAPPRRPQAPRRAPARTRRQAAAAAKRKSLPVRLLTRLVLLRVLLLKLTAPHRLRLRQQMREAPLRPKSPPHLPRTHPPLPVKTRPPLLLQVKTALRPLLTRNPQGDEGLCLHFVCRCANMPFRCIALRSFL